MTLSIHLQLIKLPGEINPRVSPFFNLFGLIIFSEEGIKDEKVLPEIVGIAKAENEMDFKKILLFM